MIRLVTGDNTFAINEALKQKVASFAGEVETFDGSDLTTHELADITTGQTLFTQRRFVVIKQPSECRELWGDAAKWFEKLSSDDTVVLVEPGVDKRTAAYKWLQKNAEIEEFPAWTERDHYKAVQWVSEEAKRRGIILSKKQVERTVVRAGYDQWALHHALEKLALADEINDELIDGVIETTPTENVFALLETVLSGNQGELMRMLEILRQTEEPYRVFGLLASQVQQLALLKFADRPVAQVARDIGARSPYMLQKIETRAKSLPQSKVKATLQAFATADTRLKTTDNEPWAIIESLLHTLQIKK